MASRSRCWISTMTWEILQIRAAMPSNCWTGWRSGRPFTPWRSIPRIQWAERIWRACWRGTGERSTGRKLDDRWQLQSTCNQPSKCAQKVFCKILSKITMYIIENNLNIIEINNVRC